MEDIRTKISAIDGHALSGEMHKQGYAIISGFLTAGQCEDLKGDYHNPGIYRKTVIMERHRFGLG
jgi:hypothetical protein